MSYVSALLIFAICTLLAVVACAPFIYLVRKRRKRRAAIEGLPAGKKLSMAEALPGLVLVLLLFLAFAHQYIAPEGWLGARVSSGEGRFWFSVLALLVVAVANYLWRSHRNRGSKPQKVDEGPKDR
jgi:nitric oxide reductase large subunit